MRWRTKHRRRDGGPARRGQHQGHHRAGLAHRARPGRGVDPRRAAVGGPPAHRGARAGPGCRRPRDRDRPDRGARLRRDPAQEITGRGAHRRALRRGGGQPPDRAASRRARAAGWSRCAWCRRASTCRGSRVGVYATSASTPLFFAQAIGRFVRARRRGETACVFLPNVPQLIALAGELELERDHALDRVGQVDLLDDALVVEANRSEPSSPGVVRVRLQGDRVVGHVRAGAVRRGRVRRRRRGRAAWRSSTSSGSPGCSSRIRCGN